MSGSRRDRDQILEWLREGEEQYQSIFEAVTDGLVIVDLDGRIVEANSAYCVMVGYNREELIGSPYAMLFHPDSLDAANTAFATVLAGEVAHAQAVFQRPDRTTFIAEGIARAFTYQGNPHVIAGIRDITRRVRAEEQLREKEAEYRGIFEATTDGLAIIGMDGTIVEANPALCRMHRHRYEDLIGRPASMLLHPDQHSRFGENLRRVTTGGTTSSRAIDVCSDGMAIHVEVRGSTLLFRGTPHILAVVQDITERVRAEEQVGEKEAQYRRIFEATNDAMAILTMDATIVEANPANCTMFGYTYDELVGRSFTDLVHPDYLQFAQETFASATSGGSPEGRVLCLRKDGSGIHVEGRTTVFTYMGSPHVLVVLRDVTEKVRAYELLEERVEERTRELSAVLGVSHNVASTLDLQPLLGLILEQLKTVVDYTGAAIFIVEEEQVRALDYRGPLPRNQVLNLRVPLTRAMGYQAVVRQRGPVIVDDRWGANPLAHVVGDLRGYFETTVGYARSVLVVPLLVKDRVIGVVRIENRQERAYTERHAMLAMAFANQAAVAIENARLYARAHDAAALEERHRLARELHDSVTQALYGVTMYAEAASSLLESGQQETAGAYLREVRETAQDALREMRLLIFELRPPVLAEEGLEAALRARLAAVEGRVGGLSTSLDVSGDIQLPPSVEEALYGIAQETLNNVFKHARAKSISLSLWQEAERVTLEIADDGEGFEQHTTPQTGSLGLRGMTERAAEVGGLLTVESRPGEGTRVHAEVPL